MKKPASLVYGAEEKPPLSIVIVSAVQHVAVIAIFMVYPLIIARQAGAPAAEIAAILRVGALALAVAVLLQALPRGPVGSHFLAPSIFTGVYLGPSLMAAKLGGLPLVWGMTIFAGFVEIGLSRVWSRLRAFIPPETAGMVVFLVGVIIGLAALHVLLGKASGDMVAGRDALVAGVSLATMIGLNIWNKGRLRLFCILIGMVVGYGLSGFTGQITGADLRAIVDQPVLALPSFAHLSSIEGGILGDGIAAVAAGLLGTYGLTVSTANVGLVAATGVASRYIAFVIAAILAVAAFQPTLIGILTIMPSPVMASALLFTAVFIMISGVQIISTRVLDPRRTLVIGAGMMAFFMVSVVPSAFAGVPHWALPLVTSPLVIATLVALSLNLVFRLGIRRTVSLEIDPNAVVLQDVVNFIERAAGVWGARRDVVTRVEFAVQQAVEAIVDFCRVKGPIALAVSYDEFDINAKLTYEGMAMELPQWAPSQEDMLESEDGPRRLAGFLVRRQADHVQNVATHGATVLTLQFKH